MTLVELIAIIKERNAEDLDQQQKMLHTLCKWHLAGDKNNILKSLLEHHEEMLAHQYMGVYERFLKKSLLTFAL
jgi:hypothetical protein